jgi:hypothetical protein
LVNCEGGPAASNRGKGQGRANCRWI